MEKEDISFLREAAPVKIESGFELHAYYPDGKQTAFKIKAHVSLCLCAALQARWLDRDSFLSF